MLHADCPPPGKTTRIRCTGPATFLTSTVRWTYLATAATFAPHRSTCLPRRDGPALGMPRSLLFTFLRRMLLWTLVGLVLAIGALVVLLQQPVFGATAQGERLERIHASPNFRNGAFQNRRFTPQLAEGYTMPGLLWEFIFSDPPRRMPTGAIPTQKHDLHALPPGDLLVWFGHSSYLLRIDGRTILVDPVLSGRVAPMPGFGKAFPGTDRYTVDDLPPIDLLLITHDHYDHLDHAVVEALRPKVAEVVCGLGVGAHMERWGYAPELVRETDWHETLTVAGGLVLHTVPARHFSGRGLKRDNTLWQSYVLDAGGRKFFLGGDSGHDTHFAEAGAAHGPFELAILECGQYDVRWKYIHLLPEEVVTAAQELGAQRLFPVHNSKFPLANHPWDEPLTKVSAFAEAAGLPLLTPMIGEVVQLADSTRMNVHWWEGVDGAAP